MADPTPDRLAALMASLLPPGSIDRREVIQAVVAELGPIRALFVGLSLKIIKRAAPALLRVGARIGVELLLRRVADWLVPILLDSRHSAASVAAGGPERVMALVGLLVDAKRNTAIHPATAAIVGAEPRPLLGLTPGVRCSRNCAAPDPVEVGGRLYCGRCGVIDGVLTEMVTDDGEGR